MYLMDSHSDTEFENNQDTKDAADGILKCTFCDVSFSRKWCYDRHMQKQHAVCQFNYECCVCSKKLKSIKDLHSHLSDGHGISMATEQKVFYSVDDFVKWKSEEEKNSVSSFVRKHGPTKRKDGSLVNFYNCHRSGKPSKGPNQRKRAYKSGGSNKCGILCPARMRAVTSKHFGGIEIFVEYCSTHLGHDMEPRKLRLQKEEKESLARRLMQGVPKEQILDDITKDFSPSKRLSLTRRKDLHNLCQSYRINHNSVFHVEGYVNEMKLDAYDPVLIYKPHGETSAEFSCVPRDDFLLALMNEVQQAIFQAYCGNVVMVDSTRIMVAYEMQLTTLMVSDDRHDAFPVAVLYSSRLTPEACIAFFMSIQNRCQNLIANVFMSDDVPLFYDAWQTVFGKVEHRLLCPWHVLRAWISELRRDVFDAKEHKAVVQDLTLMLMQTNEQAFLKLLEFNMNKYKGKETMGAFMFHFENHYVPRIKHWAPCYSGGARVNMNVMEWWDELVKQWDAYDGLKRLDKAIHFFMNAVARKILSHLITIGECDLSYKVMLLRERHNTALAMDLPEITVLEEQKKWYIPASEEGKKGSEMCEVELLEENCSCDVCCDECKACIHSYSCMCLDYCVRFNMCKHIHYVCQKFPRVMLVDETIGGDYFGDLITNGSNDNKESEAIEIFVITEVQDEEADYLELQRAAAIERLQQLISRAETCSTLDEVHVIMEAADSASVKLDAIATYDSVPLEGVVLPQGSRVLTDTEGNVLNVALISKDDDFLDEDTHEPCQIKTEEAR